MKNKIQLWVDSRDAHYFQKYGQTMDFPPSISFHDQSIPAKIQPIGNVECTCYTCEYIAQTRTKKEYDIDELFSRVPHNMFGANPNDVLGEVVKNGLLIKGTQIYDKPYSSYWRADTGNMDAFDNCRSAITLSQSPIAIFSRWYLEWLNVPQNVPLPLGVNAVSGHMYASDGWGNVMDTINVNGEPMFIIEWWGGNISIMPRATFNASQAVSGSGASVLSTDALDVLHKKTLIEWCKDIIKNIALLFKQIPRQDNKIIQQENKLDTIMLQNNIPPTTPLTPSISPSFSKKIITWANAIKAGEGAFPSSANPGNLKYSTLTASWGATQGRQATDGGFLCKFPDYDTGFKALCNFLKLGCLDELKAFHHSRTLQTFSETYAGNPPQPYIDRIGQALNIPLTTDISTFLI